MRGSWGVLRVGGVVDVLCVVICVVCVVCDVLLLCCSVL